MLERLTENFRELLKRFDGAACPLCGVLKRRAAREIHRLQVKHPRAPALCGTHLDCALRAITDPRERARRTREVLESWLGPRGGGCDVCKELGRIEARLVRAIQRLDGAMRFSKALQSAPRFCLKHVQAIGAGGVAAQFAHIEEAKVRELRDALSRAQLRNAEELESLILEALNYLGHRVEQPSLEIPSPPSSDAELTREFERWDEQRQVKRLGDLESEVASLRYRIGVLSEENQRLQLARTASEATMRQLERDREQLLAAARRLDLDPLKTFGQH